MVALKELWSRVQCPSGDQWWVAFLRGRYWDRCCLISLFVTWMVGLSALSADLPTTPSCVMWLTCCRGGMPSIGTWTGLRGGPAQTCWSSPRPSARSCAWIGATLSTNTGWVENALRAAALRRRTWGCWLMRSSAWPSNVRSQPRKEPYSGLHPQQHGQQVEGGDSAPLLHFETPPGVLCPALEPQHRTDVDLLERVQRRPQKWSEGWNTSAVRKGWESWGCSAWRREGSRKSLLEPFSTWRPTGKQEEDFWQRRVVIAWAVMALNWNRADLDYT